MKPLTTSVYTFSKLVEGGFLYVDKTAHIHRLLEPATGQYFLSRPRRFGKSLLISTLCSIFEGRKELFEGLCIAGTDYDWKTHPVIHLDMGSATGTTPEEVERAFGYLVDENAKHLGVALTRAGASHRFLELVTRAAEIGPVVILVDEYDKPLLGHLGRDDVGDYQSLLKRFYSVIKTTEQHQRFVLLTGVSKFSKVSVFSDLNNLTDLTMDQEAATLLGYTQTELEANFGDYIERLAKHEGRTIPETLEELKTWYDGYRMHHAAETVYNPVSVMRCLDSMEFKNFWFETGTPAFLVDLVKRDPLDLHDLTVPDTAFSTYDPARLAPLPLLVQTGYLTIKGAEREGRQTMYRLGYPNYEIEAAFSAWLVQDFSELQGAEVSSTLRNIRRALEAGDVDGMLAHLKTFFAQIPNTITLKNEKYYQTIFFTVFKLLGAVVEAETSTNIGRIDAVVKTPDTIHIFEFKLHGTAEEALAQIRDKQYAAPFADDPRKKILVGVAFDQQDRNLGSWLVEEA
jgi:hypothetical protein